MEQGNNKSFLSDEVVKEEELSFLSDEVVTEGDLKKKVSSEATSGVPTLLKPPIKESTLQSEQGGLDFSQTPSEILAKETPKESIKKVNSLPKANPNSVRAYEYSQHKLRDQDKKIQSLKGLSLGTDMSELPNSLEVQKQYNQELDKANQERKTLSNVANAAQKEVSITLNNIINSVNENNGWEKFTGTDNDGFKNANIASIDEYSRKVAKDSGAPETGYFQTLVKNKLKANVEYKIVEPIVNKEFEKLHKEKFGKTPTEYANENFEKAFKLDDQINKTTSLQIGAIQNELSEKIKTEVEPINNGYLTASNDLKNAYTQSEYAIKQEAEQLHKAYQSGQLTEEKYTNSINVLNSKYKLAQEDYNTKVEQDKKSYLDQMNKINNKYNVQFKRQQTEIVKIANEKLKEEAIKFSKTYKVDPKYIDETRDLYSKAYDNTAKTIQEAKNVMDVANGGAARWLEGYIGTLGNSIKGIATSANMPNVALFGETLANNFKVGDSEIKNVSDLLNINKMINSTSSLAGGMTPSILAAIPTGAASVAMGGSALMSSVVSGLASWGAETMDIAGNMYNDILAKTGNVADATKAYDESIRSQVVLMPTYAVEMLPFIQGGLSKVKSKIGKAIAGGSIEYGVEYIQEFPQNIFEQNIREGRDFNDLKEITENYTNFSKIKEQAKSTALNLIPMIGMGAVGGLSNNDDNKNKNKAIQNQINAIASSDILKNRFNQYNPYQFNQYIQDIYLGRGENFVQALAEASFANGTIDKEIYSKILEQKNKTKELVKTSKAIGLSVNDSKLYNMLMSEYDNQMEMANYVDDINVKSVIINKAKKYNQQAIEVLNLQQVPHAIVKYGDGMEMVWTEEQIQNAMNDDAFLGNVNNGNVNVSLFNTDKKIAKELNEKLNSYDEQNADFGNERIEIPRKYTSPTNDRYGYVEENGVKRELTKTEFENYGKDNVENEIRSTDNNIPKQVESPRQEIKLTPIEVIAGKEQGDGGVAAVVQGDGQALLDRKSELEKERDGLSIELLPLIIDPTEEEAKRMAEQEERNRVAQKRLSEIDNEIEEIDNKLKATPQAGSIDIEAKKDELERKYGKRFKDEETYYLTKGNDGIYYIKHSDGLEEIKTYKFQTEEQAKKFAEKEGIELLTIAKQGVGFTSENKAKYDAELKEAEQSNLPQEKAVGENVEVVANVKLNKAEKASAEYNGQKAEDVVPTRAIFKNKVNQEVADWFGNTDEEDLEENAKDIRTETVNINDITPTQLIVDKNAIGKRKDKGLLPVLVKTEDGLFVLDGHHRISSEILSGNSNVEAKIIDLTDEGVEVVAPKATPQAGSVGVGGDVKPTPQKIKVLGKDVNMYNDYIPSKVEDVEPDAMYSFNANSKDGIPSLLHDIAYANKREVNGVKSENWHASISGEDLLKLYPKEQSLKETPQAGSVGVGGDVKGKLENEGFKPTLKPNGENEFILQVDDTKPNGKRSVGVIGLKTVEVGGKKFLSIGMTNVREGYEGKGLATNMYRYLMENLPEGYDGILSPKETRWNNEQIPKIHEKLSKEYDKTELDNGDIVFKNKAVEQSPQETPQEVKVNTPEKVQEEVDKVVEDGSTSGYNPKFKTANKVLGEETTIEMPNGETREAEYMVVESDDILASHNEVSFNDTVGFPKTKDGRNANSRNYKGDKSAQLKVDDNAKNLKPSIVISDTATTDGGVPIISQEGIVVSGNGRTMAIKLSQKIAPEKYQAYKADLLKRAAKFGIDPNEVAKMKNPILVKVDKNIKNYSVKTFDEFNGKFQKEESPIDKAIKRSSIIQNDEVLKDRILSIIGRHETMSDLFDNKADRKELFDFLVANDIILKQETPKYLQENGEFTPDGKDLINDVLIATILSPETLEATSNVKAFRNKIINALPVLTVNYKLGKNSLETEINDAILLQSKIATMGSQEEFWTHLKQLGMFETANPNTVIINRMINNGAINFKKFIVTYNKSMEIDENNLFAADQVLTKQQVIDNLKQSNLKENEKQIITNLEELYAANEQKRPSGNAKVDGGNKAEQPQNPTEKAIDVYKRLSENNDTSTRKEYKALPESIKRVLDNIVNIHQQLEQKEIITKIGNCP